MLYHFPNESPDDLLEQDRLRLEREIKSASRVEREGYRKKECSLSSFYIEYRCINQYLKCPITKWKMPKSSKDKIEVEPLPTEFLSMRNFYKPLYFHHPEFDEKVRRIVGYREIQQKREYVEYLRDVETSYDDGFDSDHRIAENTMKTNNGDWEIKVDASSGEDEDECENEMDSDDSAEVNQKSLEVARGGGRNQGGRRKGPSRVRAGRGAKGRRRGKSKGYKMPKFEDVALKDSPPDRQGSMFHRLSSIFGLEDSTRVRGRGKKEIEKTATQLEKATKENLEEIFKFHGMFRVPAQIEKDNEWLELSDSDAAENKDPVIETFNKELLHWMKDGMSFESQYLAHTLRPFLFSLMLTGRSFLSTKPDMEKKHIDFLHRRRDLIVFFLSSFFFWVCFVMMTVAFLDIQWENQQNPTGKSSGTLLTLEDMQSQAQYAQHEVEELELNKYKIPVMLVMINLSLTAIWSLLMILGDGIYVAHYFNCWSAALAEMETSGCIGIQKKIFLHHIYFFTYTTLMCVGFYYDYPEHFRHFSGEISVLVFRAFRKKIRINTDEILLPYQMAGMGLQIYIVYSTSMIKLMMQILAMVLKNASEMWNFKFALTFEQLTSRNRAQVIKLSLHHSLLKLFTHHRILTVLLRNFGEVFSIPIMIYMVCEMGVLTLILVEMFFYKAGTADDYDGQESVLIVTQVGPNSSQIEEELRIQYFHAPAEDYLMNVFILIQVLFQYIGTTEILSKAGASFFTGYEFVRRSGTVLCKNSHQRRLIQSLEWSFSSTNPSILSANSYFTINREAILSAFGAVIGFFSLIIQLQVTTKKKKIEFLNYTDCAKIKDHILVHGACELKDQDQLDDRSLDIETVTIKP